MLGSPQILMSNMAAERNISLGLATAVTSLLLLVQPLRIFASGIVTRSTVCGGVLMLYSDLNGYEFFYINEDSVDKTVFCEILQFYNANHCLLWSFYGSNLCGLDSSLGRRLLHIEKREELSVANGDPKGIASLMKQKNDQQSLATPRNIGIGAAGTFVLCCAFLCPCLYRKRRPTNHEVLANDSHSMDGTHSFEVHKPSEKASPLRVPVPPSPSRVPVPPSPSRVPVPPSPSRISISPKLNKLGSIHLSASQAARATRNFSSSLIIGEGGFGTVYKAQLEDGHVVAIKRAKREHFQNLRIEFSSEIELLAKIEHHNLVKLLGYVDRGNERLIITEYVGNGTLREHLDGQRGKILDFHQRLGIAIDIAHGLTYLHLYAEKQIIHRDVKSSNILLTESMRAKVADFGFARLGPTDTSETHISTQVKGTVGYLDPEYMKTYQLTTKSDVFSFGILVVEILTGRRPLELKRRPEERVTIRWAFNKYSERNVEEMLDPLMEEVVNVEILIKMFELAFDCAAPIRSDRPEMKVVVEQLWAIRADYMNSKRQ